MTRPYTKSTYPRHKPEPMNESAAEQKKAEKGPTPPSTFQALKIVELMLVHQVSVEQMAQLLSEAVRLLNETHRKLSEE